MCHYLYYGNQGVVMSDELILLYLSIHKHTQGANLSTKCLKAVISEKYKNYIVKVFFMFI